MPSQIPCTKPVTATCPLRIQDSVQSALQTHVTWLDPLRDEDMMGWRGVAWGAPRGMLVNIYIYIYVFSRYGPLMYYRNSSEAMYIICIHTYNCCTPYKSEVFDSHSLAKKRVAWNTFCGFLFEGVSCQLAYCESCPVQENMWSDTDFLHPWKLTSQWKSNNFKMYLLLENDECDDFSLPC